MNLVICKISVFRHGKVEVFTILGCCAALVGKWLPLLQKASWRLMQSRKEYKKFLKCLVLEDGNSMLSWNGNQLPTYATWHLGRVKTLSCNFSCMKSIGMLFWHPVYVFLVFNWHEFVICYHLYLEIFSGVDTICNTMLWCIAFIMHTCPGAPSCIHYLS